MLRIHTLMTWGSLLACFKQVNFSPLVLEEMDGRRCSQYLITFLAGLYESTGRAIALPTVSALVLVSALRAASALIKMLKFNFKVFRISYFINPQMDLVYIWFNYRCWSKILLSLIHTPACDLLVKVIDLEILC